MSDLTDLAARLGGVRWSAGALGPALRGPEDIDLIDDVLLRDGRLVNPVKGEHMDWKSMFFARKMLREALEASAGVTFDEARALLRPYRGEIDLTLDRNRSYFDSKRAETDGSIFEADLADYAPGSPEIVDLLLFERQCGLIEDESWRLCIEDFRLLRVVNEDGAWRLFFPQEDAQIGERREIVHLFTSELPDAILTHVGRDQSASKPKSPLSLEAKDWPVVEIVLGELIQYPPGDIPRGAIVDAINAARVELGLQAEKSEHKDTRRIAGRVRGHRRDN